MGMRNRARPVGVRRSPCRERRTGRNTDHSPTKPVSAKAGMDDVTLEVGLRNSYTMWPITVAGGGKARKGKSRLVRRASGRRNCTTAVGRNFRPNKLLLLAARAARTAGL